jgi:glycosyltransferase involved in cell wall biosynthesis
MTPTVSVLMPVHNAEPYLARAVDSILGQTFAEFEFLIIDDGSTDRSRATLERYAAREPRIHLVSRPNTGYTIALNELLGLARGEFVARMDADDVALPHRLAHQVAFLRQHPDVVCVGSAVHFIDAAGRLLRAGHPGMEHEEILKRALAGDCALNHPSVLMRRAALVSVGGYRPEFEPAEDLDLWLRLGEVGRLATLSEVLMQYRQHARSFSEQYQRRQLERSAAAVRDARRRRGLRSCEIVVPPWRPVDRRSRMQTFAGYGQLGVDRGDYAMALHYAARAIGQLPWRTGGWMVLAKLARRLLGLRRPVPPASSGEPDA